MLVTRSRDCGPRARPAEISRQPRSQERCSALPDGVLWTLSTAPSGDMIVAITFKRNIFSDATIGEMAAEFSQVLRDAVAAPDAPLSQT